jgi:hypothetical protein
MKRILRLINEISLAWMLAGLTAVIVGFAGIYWAFGVFGVGMLEFTAGNQRAVTFWDALYFSLVTVSSLGYGDIRPVGWTRLFVGLEVILGLSFFGLLVAKISSVKQDYILRRMYYSDVIDRRLKEFADDLDEKLKLYRITSNMLLSGDIDPELTYTFKAEVKETTLFYQLHALLREIDELVEFEIHNGDFFGDVSDTTMSRILASVQGVLDHTLRLIERDADSACEYVLCGNERWIEDISDFAEELAMLGQRHSANEEIVEQCERIEELAGRMRVETAKHFEAAGGTNA